MKNINDILNQEHVYKIENKEHIYIGRTNNISRRIYEHLKNGVIHNYFGKELIILFTGTKEEVKEKEIKFINEYKNKNLNKKLLNKQYN